MHTQSIEGSCRNYVCRPSSSDAKGKQKKIPNNTFRTERRCPTCRSNLNRYDVTMIWFCPKCDFREMPKDGEVEKYGKNKLHPKDEY